MVFDSLENSALYKGLSDRIKLSFDYLRQTDFSILEPGKHEIDGSNIFALLSRYETKPLETCSWEAHKQYIDIQYVIKGAEKMGIAQLSSMTIKENYNEEKDYMLLDGKGDFLTVKEGQFVIFWPSDVHMPQLEIIKPAEVLKVVLKLKIA
jgi:YhcH/YjgK/YiaL family protein